MTYVFGPVPSRRLGLSLGVDIIPFKTCSLSCRYCQVGETPVTSLERKAYVPVDAVLDEIELFFRSGKRADWVTLSGSGEPTLHSGIGDIIAGVKRITDVPVCVITNGTLLWDREVRRAILPADAVMPSLDSATGDVFRVLCQPHPDLSIERIIEGLAAFRDEYAGELWLEILLVDGVNDTKPELAALKTAIELIRPDRIQLNTVVRPPYDTSVYPVEAARLEQIRDYFGDRAEVVAAPFTDIREGGEVTRDDILAYLRRRPGSVDDICTALGASRIIAERMLDALARDGEIRERGHYGKRYWEYIPGERGTRP